MSKGKVLGSGEGEPGSHNPLYGGGVCGVKEQNSSRITPGLSEVILEKPGRLVRKAHSREHNCKIVVRLVHQARLSAYLRGYLIMRQARARK
jgi:hypothetical protein